MVTPAPHPRRTGAEPGPRSALFLAIRETLYAVQSVPCDPLLGARAYRLRKADGTLYDVAQTPFGPECDCPDFIFRRDGIDPDGCKHVRALVAYGLIDGGSEGGGRR